MIDVDAILRTLPHRYPFLMVDRVVECVPGERAVGVKCVSVNEPHFQGHFPERAIMPGVLIAEAFAQVAAVVALSANPDRAGASVYLLGLDKLRFRKPVRPGDVLYLHVEKDTVRRAIWTFRCRAEVDGEKVADGRLMATVGAP